LENQVSTISITLLRKQGPTAVCEHLCSLEKVFHEMILHAEVNLLLTLNNQPFILSIVNESVMVSVRMLMCLRPRARPKRHVRVVTIGYQPICVTLSTINIYIYLYLYTTI
jgi:hypothetical protein